MTLLKHHGVSNHPQVDFLFNSLSRLTTKNTSKLLITGRSWGESRQVDSPGKGPLIRKVFSYYDVILHWVNDIFIDRTFSQPNPLDRPLLGVGSFARGRGSLSPLRPLNDVTHRPALPSIGSLPSLGGPLPPFGATGEGPKKSSKKDKTKKEKREKPAPGFNNVDLRVNGKYGELLDVQFRSWIYF